MPTGSSVEFGSKTVEVAVPHFPGSSIHTESPPGVDPQDTTWLKVWLGNATGAQVI